MLKQRIITAVILAFVVVGTIFLLDRFYVSVLFAVILFISMLELVDMTISKRLLIQWIIGLVMVGLFFFSLPQMGMRTLLFHSAIGLLVWLAILLWMIRYRFSGHWAFRSRLSIGLLSTLLLWICIHGLVFIHQHFEQGAWLLMYMLTLVWLADIGAYFSGKKFGRNKLAPAISPGKTREGVLGGLALNSIWISFVYTLTEDWGMDYIPFLILGLITSIISVVGDLYISILKREAGIKDTGKILPGHGGVLDRIDSAIAATPVFLSGLFLMGAV